MFTQFELTRTLRSHWHEFRLYLAKWDARDYPEPEAGQEQRVRDWIRAKYIEKRW